MTSLHDSNYMAFLKTQNYKVIKKISGTQGFVDLEKKDSLDMNLKKEFIC